MDYDNHDLFVFILTFFVAYSITFTIARMFCRFVLPRMACDLAGRSFPF